MNLLLDRLDALAKRYERNSHALDDETRAALEDAAKEIRALRRQAPAFTNAIAEEKSDRGVFGS